MWKFFNKSGQEKVQDSAYLPICNVIYDKLLLVDEASFDIPIPATYKDLRVVFHGRSTEAAANSAMYIRFNNDTGSNYSWEQSRDLGSTVSASGVAGDTKIQLQDVIPAATSPASYASACVIDIPNYIDTTFFQSILALAYGARAVAITDHFLNVTGAKWRNVARIDRLTIFLNAGLFAAGSRVTVYGYASVPLPAPGSTLPVTYGTSLPVSPLEGQEAILVDSVTTPSYQWRFRYDPNISDANKWVFVGGAAGCTIVAALENAPGTSYAALTTPGPSFTVPRAGDYLIEIGADMSTSNGPGSNQAVMSYDIGVTAAVDADSARVYSGGAWVTGVGAMSLSKKSLAAGTTLVAKYKYTPNASASFARRFMRVTPVRVA